MAQRAPWRSELTFIGLDFDLVLTAEKIAGLHRAGNADSFNKTISKLKEMIQRFSKVLYVTPRKLCTAAGYLPSLQRLSSTTAEAKYGDKLRRKAKE